MIKISAISSHVRLLFAAAVFVILAGCQALPQQAKPSADVHTSSTPPIKEQVIEVPLPPVSYETHVLPVKQPKIALVLGGGGARGFAHVGVIRALEKFDIYPSIVVGTSAGSLVGALYASGNNSTQLMHLAEQMNEAAISDWSFPFFSGLSGLLKGEAIQAYVNRAVNNKPIEKFKLSFAAVATDIQTGETYLFRRGNAGLAVRASSAVPGLFQPVKIGNKEFVDGGLTAPVPVKYARNLGADVIIAVNISADPERQTAKTTSQILLQTFAIMGKKINEYALNEADIVVSPALHDMKSSDFAKRRFAISAGERAATQLMPEIQRKIQEKRMQLNR